MGSSSSSASSGSLSSAFSDLASQLDYEVYQFYIEEIDQRGIGSALGLMSSRLLIIGRSNQKIYLGLGNNDGWIQIYWKSSSSAPVNKTGPYTPYDGTTLKDVLNKAREFQNSKPAKYSLSDNNCYHFVDYMLWDLSGSYDKHYALDLLNEEKAKVAAGSALIVAAATNPIGWGALAGYGLLKLGKRIFN